MVTTINPTKKEITVRPSALETGLATVVGNTPLLPLHSIAADVWPQVQVYAKAEWFNPGGSVKDRPALNILRAALEDGKLSPGKRLLDSTSGNMGIAYATLAASMGIPVTLALPENASPERIKILRALGAELVLTDPLEGSDGAMLVAQQMAEEKPELYFYANQYDNPANWLAHYQTTGPEIWGQTGGAITHMVAGMGTSGTITGTTRYLKEKNPAIRSIAFYPDSPFHGLEGLKYMPTAHKPGIYDPHLPDEIREVGTEDAYAMVRRLGREEGLFVGISAGAAAVASLRVAEEIAERGEQGVVVTVFPDAGYKYLTSNLWEEQA
ncbi:cysteine synthase family protein [bacterium]|nr:cysteine synthase family protein [bacterium]MCB2179175.1 cysteine synthase family protein [bacterium]